MLKGNNILIVIPAYNEEKSLVKELGKIRSEFPDILVVDDGSTDNTSAVSSRCKADVITLPFNMGIGTAVQTGLKYSILNDYDIVVRVDADGQHPVGGIKKLLDFLEKNKNVDAIIGTRYLEETEYKGSKIRKLSTGFLSLIVSLITGQKFTDVTSGFFALRKNAIKFLADNYSEDYPEVESIILLVKNNFKIKEVSVAMTNRTSGSSSITFLNSIYYMIKVMLAILIFSFEKKKNRR